MGTLINFAMGKEKDKKPQLQRKEIHKGKTINQIDHAVVEQKHEKFIKKSGSMRRLDTLNGL